MSSGRLVAEIKPEVDVDRSIAAEALEAPLLEHAQQLGLRHQRHVADFVEEQRAAVGQLEAAGLAIVRAGERALFVAEDFRLEQAVGQRRAVDRLEVLGPRRDSSWIMRATTSLPAPVGPRISTEMSGLRRGADPLEDGQHLLVAADHLAEALHRRRRFLDAEVGAAFEEDLEQLGDRLAARAVIAP